MIHKSYMTAKKILWKAYLMALGNVDVQLALAKFTFFSWKISRDFVEKDRLKNIYMFTVAMAHDTPPPHPADCVVSSVLLFFSFFYCVFHWGGGGGCAEYLCSRDYSTGSHHRDREGRVCTTEHTSQKQIWLNTLLPLPV